jgi:Spy/CpxP family protein refolding chaperone
MKRINKTTAILLSALFLLVSGSTFAQMQKKGMGMRKNAPDMHQQCMNMIPDLTEEQESKIEDLRLSHMKEMMQSRNQLNEKRAERRSLQTQDNPDMEAIYSVIEEMGKIRTGMNKDRAKHHQEIRSLLNEEQKIFFDNHMMMKRGRMHHNGRSMRGRGCPGGRGYSRW